MVKLLLAVFVLACAAGLALADDACSSNPCANGATCNEGSGFNCTCALGFTGHTCESPIDYCVSSPCSNSGECMSHPSGFDCICDTGLTGLLCETDINGCLSNPCLNGGSCHDQPFFHDDTYYCTCPGGYSGSTCQIVGDPCVNVTCQNGGTCEALTVLTYQCNCVQGYTGDACQNEINECTSSPCANGGSCHSGVNNFTCTCIPGYTGVLCQSQIDFCASSPCQNGGTCVSVFDGFECLCASDYFNTTCNTNDQCQAQYIYDFACFSNGICTDGYNSTTCNCTGTGSIGNHCEIPYIPLVFTGAPIAVDLPSLGISLTLSGPPGNDTNFVLQVSVYNPLKDNVTVVESTNTPVIQSFVIGVAGDVTDLIPPGGSYPVFANPIVVQVTIPPLSGSDSQRVYAFVQITGTTIVINLGKITVGSRRRDGGGASINVTSPGLVSAGVVDACLVPNNTDPNVNACGTGVNCTAVDLTYICSECYSNPCQNGGTCTDGTAYTCACPPEFTGANCQDRLFGFSRCKAEVYCSDVSLITSDDSIPRFTTTDSSYGRVSFQQLVTGEQFGVVDVYSQGNNDGTEASVDFVVHSNAGTTQTSFALYANEANHTCIFEVTPNLGVPTLLDTSDVGATFDTCQVLVYVEQFYQLGHPYSG